MSAEIIQLSERRKARQLRPFDGVALSLTLFMACITTIAGFYGAMFEAAQSRSNTR